MIIHLTVKLTKKISFYKMGYFIQLHIYLEPYIELQSSNCATKSHLKSAVGINTSKFAKTIDFGKRLMMEQL